MKKVELTQQRPEQEQTAGKLLSPEERGVSKQLAAGGEAPWSQRAQALLALDEGATLAGAGSQAGLTQTQVRYWLGRYREDGLSIFPEAELSQTQPEPAQETKAPPQAVGEAAAATAEKPKQKKKKKKKGKAKKSKGTSGRSDKKSKKKGKK